MTQPARGPYSEAVLQHFREPRNLGTFPAEEARVGRGDTGHEDDGRRVVFELKSGPDRCVLAARFRAFGCPVTIACSSWATEYVLGRALDQLEALRSEDLAAALDLRATQMGAAELVVEAISAARQDL